MDASLKEVQLTAQHWELEAKEAADKAERDVVQHETVMARLETEAAGNAREQVELELSRVQCALTTADGGRLKAEFELDSARQALASAKEACRRANEENSRLTNERMSLLMELGAIKEDFTSFRAKSFEEKLALKAEFDASSDVIFNYGYGCCTFAHDICGSKPMIPAGMPDTSTPLPLEFSLDAPRTLRLSCPLLSPSRLLEKIFQSKISRLLRKE